ncbi:MAG: alcohol dehydrogenase catalytic domain-containing protein [Dehalococcoidia bacterium]|nr:alcohol dehydrogenase catalytic domain-containing protein [Dehalococcoidia bacterium]
MKALRFSVTVPQYLALKVLGRVRQAYYSGPLATVRLAEVPEPVLPSPEWVKIRTMLCGLCGTDMNLIFLRDSPTATPFTSFPCTLGHEVCGQVTEVGSRVEGITPGDMVTVCPPLGCQVRGIEPMCRMCQAGRPSNCENFAEGKLAPGLIMGLCRDVGGGFAPYFVAHKSQIYRLPPGISSKEGIMIEPLAVAVQAVIENEPREGDRVLVVGGGVIGNLIVQAIRSLGSGCSITVAEPSRFHAELAEKAGADHVIVDGDIQGHALSITGARRYQPMLGLPILMGGFSKVFDTVASTSTLTTSMRVLRGGGVLSVVGISKDPLTDLTPLWLKLQTIKGVYCYGFVDVQGQKRHVFEMAIDLIKNRKVSVEQMVTHTFRIEDYRAMITVNLHKQRHKAVKTALSFEG